jgi:ribosomal-protein-alanine N-acetyltransferase
MVENAASARVLEKLGLQFEGTHRSALFHRGRFWDLKMFAAIRSRITEHESPRRHGEQGDGSR